MTAQWLLVEILENTLGGAWEPGEGSMESRRDGMLEAFAKAVPYSFTPSVQIDPVAARILIDALSSRWTFEPRRDRDVWWHVANAFSLLVERISPTSNAGRNREIEVESDFNPGG